MSFEVTKDVNLFRKIWANERDCTPQFMQDGNNTWHTGEDDFLGFCEQCDRVYNINGTSLLYVERLSNYANVHFSLIRGEKVELNDLISIRDEIFQDFDLIFGWIGLHNRPLKRLVESCGLRYDGFRMYYGFSHSKLLEWRCYSLAKNSIAQSSNL